MSETKESRAIFLENEAALGSGIAKLLLQHEEINGRILNQRERLMKSMAKELSTVEGYANARKKIIQLESQRERLLTQATKEHERQTRIDKSFLAPKVRGRDFDEIGIVKNLKGTSSAVDNLTAIANQIESSVPAIKEAIDEAAAAYRAGGTAFLDASENVAKKIPLIGDFLRAGEAIGKTVWGDPVGEAQAADEKARKQEQGRLDKRHHDRAVEEGAGALNAELQKESERAGLDGFNSQRAEVKDKYDQRMAQLTKMREEANKIEDADQKQRTLHEIGAAGQAAFNSYDIERGEISDRQRKSVLTDIRRPEEIEFDERMDNLKAARKSGSISPEDFAREEELATKKRDIAIREFNEGLIDSLDALEPDGIAKQMKEVDKRFRDAVEEREDAGTMTPDVMVKLNADREAARAEVVRNVTGQIEDLGATPEEKAANDINRREEELLGKVQELVRNGAMTEEDAQVQQDAIKAGADKEREALEDDKKKEEEGKPALEERPSSTTMEGPQDTFRRIQESVANRESTYMEELARAAERSAEENKRAADEAARNTKVAEDSQVYLKGIDDNLKKLPDAIKQEVGFAA